MNSFQLFYHIPFKEFRKYCVLFSIFNVNLFSCELFSHTIIKRDFLHTDGNLKQTVLSVFEKILLKLKITFANAIQAEYTLNTSI